MNERLIDFMLLSDYDPEQPIELLRESDNKLLYRGIYLFCPDAYDWFLVKAHASIEGKSHIRIFIEEARK